MSQPTTPSGLKRFGLRASAWIVGGLLAFGARYFSLDRSQPVAPSAVARPTSSSAFEPVPLAPSQAASPEGIDPEVRSADYASARKEFQTRLLRREPAPQKWDEVDAPRGVEVVEYVSGKLRLKAWASKPRQLPAGKSPSRQPAVLFLHGGFAFGADDWDQTLPYREADYVVMTPLLRAENGQVGSYSMFFHEVSDVLAAAETLAARPDVDPDRIYVAGHSIGGTLAMLSAMASDRFAAAASFSGSPDQRLWSRDQPEVVPFDPNEANEFEIRSPLAWARSFQCPTRLYFGELEPFFRSSTLLLAQRAQTAGLDVEAMEVRGDHMSSVKPAMQSSIAFFKSRSRPAASAKIP